MKRFFIIILLLCMSISAIAQKKYAVLITGDYAAKEPEVPLSDQWNEGQDRDSDDYVYDYWDDVVTKQPEGYVVDEYGNVEISTPEGFAWLSCVVNGNNGCAPDNFKGRTVRLTSDINLEADGLRNFTPIGNSDNRFMGTFDGEGHAIDGLLMDNGYPLSPTEGDKALFGYLYNGTVKNLNINSCGYCFFYDSPELPYYSVLVAISDSLSLVDNCRLKMRALSTYDGSAGLLNVSMNIGSIVGLNRNSTVRNCCYEMPATYGLYVGFEYDGGGIVFRNLSEGGFADAVVENCYFYGEMRPSYGGKNIGGIVCFNETGLNTEGKRAIVRNCYVEDNGVMIGFEDVGLIVAYNSPLSLVENCYGDVWAGDPYSQSLEIVGNNKGEVANCARFTPSSVGGVLNEEVSVGDVVTTNMFTALSAWVSNADDPAYIQWLPANVGGMGLPTMEDAVICSIADTEEITVSMSLSPNPATAQVRIVLPDGEESRIAEVFSLDGRLVLSATPKTNVIDISNLAAGMYIVKVTTDNGESFEKKIVKE